MRRLLAVALAALAGAADATSSARRGANHPAPSAAVLRAAQASAAALRGDAASEPSVREVPVSQADAPLAALAEVGDLAGLLACLDAWGRRVAVGATLALAHWMDQADRVDVTRTAKRTAGGPCERYRSLATKTHDFRKIPQCSTALW